MVITIICHLTKCTCAIYQGPGRTYLTHECGNGNLSPSQKEYVRSMLLVTAFGAGDAYPNRSVTTRQDFIGTGHCPGIGLGSPYKQSPSPYKLAALCATCLDHITDIMNLEFCMEKDWGKYASTECVITYRYSSSSEIDQEACPNLWPPQIYNP